MNLAELARKIHISLEELKTALPQLGFDIGQKAIKIDDRLAWKIIQEWPRLKKHWEEIKKAQTEAGQESEPKILEKKIIKIPQFLTVKDFAALLGLPVNRVINELMKNGILATLNDRLDFSTLAIIAEDLGFEVQVEEELRKENEEKTKLDILKEIIFSEDKAKLQPRAPVVVVMGHVDHGKTKLLDTIRKTNVVATEAGGITQHIGAYQVDFHGKKITFIDTPGHEAFTTMRSRGAMVADIAILIVAADDGVQPQTLEALNIIKAAKLPYLVAVNKMDKEGADLEKVKSQLSASGVIPEDWGGQVPFIPISAKTGLNISSLLETILLLAEMNKEKILANKEGKKVGTVIESHIDKEAGILATVLVQNGTFNLGDFLICNDLIYGKIRALKDWDGKTIFEVPPGMPARILGFKVLPDVGEIVFAQKEAKGLKKAEEVYTSSTTIAQPIAKEKKALNILLKTDVLGSLEALSASLDRLSYPEVQVKIIFKNVGDITESDVLQAEAASALIYGFNVKINDTAWQLAQEKKVKIKIFNIIYDLLDDLKSELKSMLSKEIVSVYLGKCKVLKVFKREKKYTIAGGIVEDGKIYLKAKVKIWRNGKVVDEGEVAELQLAKQAVSEVGMGREFGMKINSLTNLEENDYLEIFKEEEKEKQINS